MDFVYIDLKLWEVLGGHAKSEYPFECTGYFEAKRTEPSSLRITKIVPCINVIRGNAKKHKSRMARKDIKQVVALMRSNRDMVYGIYHSHPSSGDLWLGEADSYLGKHAKRYKHQIIVGVRAHGTRTKKAFWHLEGELWTEAEIIVK